MFYYQSILSAFGIILVEAAFPLESAFAYLDPGTGSMMLQALIAGFVAIGVTGGIYWRRFKKFFTRNKKEDGVGHKK
ncbi:LPXTG cell wall anchor domain-containing protein [Desulfotignum phosphitoxidans]|jgi:LPXTG-motif cell wall-anchored protein|uniref:Uncharacterized protein n=1 Tax=Desulfotignum phosphitoxidans DSM 13687 TaxID=1286635 RepID=S0FXT1_9BACT|nr:LPXTG cell wall anchor domain-containing protein [Desulfotignum phosphitoxidans]EMS79535.1 hypothetical protein Dpo_4c00820 [Desulfotignum phosphitoxidans DSM 13687]